MVKYDKVGLYRNPADVTQSAGQRVSLKQDQECSLPFASLQMES
jgi:hypothetical protein